MRIGRSQIERRTTAPGRVLSLALLVACVCMLSVVVVGAPAQDLGAKLERTQGKLDRVQASQDDLAASIAEQNRRVDDLIAQVAAMQARVAAVRERLAAKQAELDKTVASLDRQRKRLEVMRARLRRALGVLREELVAIYKSGDPDVVSVVLESASWADVVAQTDYLNSLQGHFDSVVNRVRDLRDQTQAAVERLRAARDRIEAARDAIAAEERRLESAQAVVQQRHDKLKALQAARQQQLDELQSREQALQSNLSAITDQLASGPGTTAPSNPVPSPQPGQTATLLSNGLAAPPASAPAAVQAAIQAANQIVGTPYIWGGGHGSFESSGYDCSGAVSYALHGGGWLDAPLDSTGLSTWGVPGYGSWVTVYANSGHTFAVIAGLRWDTSDTGGSGPGWHSDMRSGAGYIARHPSGY